MAFEARAKRIVNVPKSYFWERIRAFDKIKTLLPNNILEVKLPDDFSNNIGDTRYVYLGDPYPGEVIERLDSCYDDSYLTYSIIDKSCLPMVNYVACVSLKEVSESQTDVDWCSHFKPVDASEEEVTELLSSLYYLIFDNIEEQYQEIKK
mgnify:FL=1|tara:strand:+ start:12724 stop:13173 length:450 start_codon:yes stop_codon:yes gene_type:complete